MNDEDLYTYVDMIINKFKEANGYSEINDERLKQSITLYIEDEYIKEINKLADKIKKDRDDGVVRSDEHYRIQHILLEGRVLEKISQLAMVRKDN